MRRREFIAGLVGSSALPLAARAQQPAMPVVGALFTTSIEAYTDRLRAFRQGLKEAGYIEGENVEVLYRWAEGQNDRMIELAAELVRRRVTVIATGGGVTPVAKAATRTIPIVFLVGEDPVRLGLVTNLARPSGNLTGINFFSAELVAKRLELLRELVPAAARVAVIVNPALSVRAESTLKEMQTAASAMGLQVVVLNASTSREIDAAFETFVRERPDALFVGTDPFLTSRRVQLAILAARHSIPAAYASRENVEVGGLMSYGASITDAFRQVGVYCGRIIKGAKPADLPVMQASKFELVINVQTARTLGLTVPPLLLARADEVIE